MPRPLRRRVDLHALRDPLHALCQEAAQAILEVYEADWDEQGIVAKADDSPLTKADLASHDAILQGLPAIHDVPIVSEEGGAADGGHEFWLVDPLDGTKEFIKRNGEFTVNIALIRGGLPVLGIVQMPVTGAAYFGADDEASRFDGEAWQPIAVAHAHDVVTAVVSKSHRGEAVDAYLQALRDAGHPVQDASYGSSLKLCKVAEGSAHVYPRLGPTMPWDTAAADAVVRAAGGSVTNVAGQPLRYDAPRTLNPWFIVGGTGLEWHRFAAGIE